MTASQNDGSKRLREGRVDRLRRKPLVRAMDQHTKTIFVPRSQAVPRGMGALFRALLGKLKRPVVRTSEQEIAHGLEIVRLKSPTQLAGALARALAAKKSLDTTRQVEMSFPTEVLAAATPPTVQERELLLQYVAELKVFRSKCEHTDTPLTQAVHGGLDLWIALFECVGHADKFATAREIWTELERGRTEVEGALAFMLRRALTDIEKEYLTYVPALLAR